MPKNKKRSTGADAANKKSRTCADGDDQQKAEPGLWRLEWLFAARDINDEGCLE